MADDNGILGKMLLTVVVIVMMIPGLVVEPGPVSEIVGIGVLAAIWVPGASEDVSDEL